MPLLGHPAGLLSIAAHPPSSSLVQPPTRETPAPVHLRPVPKGERVCPVTFPGPQPTALTPLWLRGWPYQDHPANDDQVPQTTGQEPAPSEAEGWQPPTKKPLPTFLEEGHLQAKGCSCSQGPAPGAGEPCIQPYEALVKSLLCGGNAKVTRQFSCLWVSKLFLERTK